MKKKILVKTEDYSRDIYFVQIGEKTNKVTNYFVLTFEYAMQNNLMGSSKYEIDNDRFLDFIKNKDLQKYNAFATEPSIERKLLKELEQKNSTFLTAEELAKKLDVNIMTIYRYIKAGRLKAYKIGKEFRIDKTEFDVFMDKVSTKK